MPTKILFMDDDPERHERFKKMVEDVLSPDTQIHYAWNALTAKDLMSRHRYDLVCLDHDLSVDDQMCDPDAPTREENGTVVARFIRDELEPKMRPALAILHSFNPTGRRAMAEALTECGVPSRELPFGTYTLG